MRCDVKDFGYFLKFADHLLFSIFLTEDCFVFVLRVNLLNNDFSFFLSTWKRQKIQSSQSIARAAEAIRLGGPTCGNLLDLIWVSHPISIIIGASNDHVRPLRQTQKAGQQISARGQKMKVNGVNQIGFVVINQSRKRQNIQQSVGD